MNWSRDRLVSLPIAMVIRGAAINRKGDGYTTEMAMEDLFTNPSDEEFDLIVKLAFELPEARGMNEMFWGDKEVTR
jgi:CO/xanthine dehydrogenase FAD-binding subunit